VRTTGLGRSEDPGMSSAKTGEKPVRRKPKGSWGRLIRPGLGGPKPRPKGVGDGQPVKIPAPLSQRYYRWGDAVGKAIRGVGSPRPTL